MAGRGIIALVGAVVVVLSGVGVPPTALADESDDSVVEAETGESEPGTAEKSGPLREGQIVTVAGTGEEGYSGDGHDALDARINKGARISVDPDGSVYIADRNMRLRAVSPDGVIDTVPDTRVKRSPKSASDGVHASAVGPDGSVYLVVGQSVRRIDESGEHHVISGPEPLSWIDEDSDIAVDDDGTVYVTDSKHLRVHSIDADGTITAIAGGGELDPGENEGGEATESKIFHPRSVAVDSAGSVYVSHSGHVSEIAPDGTISTVVVVHEPGYAGDGGPAEDARMGDMVGGLAVDADDNVYIADTVYGVVRRVDGEGTISTVGVDFNDVDDLAIGPDGNLYFVSWAQVKMFVLNAAPADSDDEQGDKGDESPWSDRDPGEVATVAGVERDPEEVQKELEARQDGQQTLLDDGAKPGHVAAGPDGTVYYTAEDLNQVGAVAPDGTVEVIAGTGERGFSGDGGPAVNAELESTGGVAVDDDGVVYVAENGRVRMIDQDGVISTVAGTGHVPADGDAPLGDDGPATEAYVTTADVAVGPDSSLYIADPGNKRIRRVGPDGVITTVAGGGELWAEEADGVPAAEASLSKPGSVAVDSDGYVYFTQFGLSQVRKISPDGVLTTIAGVGHLELEEGGFGGDGGPANQAELNTPTDVTAGPDGDVYVADQYNARVRRIDPDGTIDTVAGTGERDDTGDEGPAVDAAVHEPTSVAVGPDGSLYFTGPDSGTIRTVDTDGTISTLADVSGEDHQVESANAGDIELNVEGIAAGPGGSLYVTDGDRGSLMVNPDGSASSTPFGCDLHDVVSAGDGSFYVASRRGGVHQVYPDGGSIRVAGGGKVNGPPEDGALATAHGLVITDLAVDPDGVLHMLHNDEGGNTVYRLEQDDTLTVVTELDEETSAGTGFAVDSDGGLYRVAEIESRVVRIDDGDTTTVAGVGSGESSKSDVRDGDGGDATDATVYSPKDVVVADDGALYIADAAGVRRVDSGGTISTVYEAPEEEAEDGTTVSRPPRALSIGSNGDVYFVDPSTEQVRVIVQADEVPNPFPWGTTAAIGLPLIVVGAVLGVWRRRQLAELIQRLRRRGDVDADPDGGGGEAATASTS